MDAFIVDVLNTLNIPLSVRRVCSFIVETIRYQNKLVDTYLNLVIASFLPLAPLLLWFKYFMLELINVELSFFENIAPFLWNFSHTSLKLFNGKFRITDDSSRTI